MKVTGDISAVIHTSGQLQERKWKIIISERPHCKKWVKSPILANKNRTDCFLFVFSHTCLNFTLFKSFIGNESIYYGNCCCRGTCVPTFESKTLIPTMTEDRRHFSFSFRGNALAPSAGVLVPFAVDPVVPTEPHRQQNRCRKQAEKWDQIIQFTSPIGQ